MFNNYKQISQYLINRNIIHSKSIFVDYDNQGVLRERVTGIEIHTIGIVMKGDVEKVCKIFLNSPEVEVTEFSNLELIKLTLKNANNNTRW